jgi:hypothetical protein
VGAENAVTSCDLQVFVDQSAETVASKVPNVGAGRCWSGSSGWWLLIEGSVRSVSVVVLDELGQDLVEVSWSGDEDVVEAFAAQGADPALRDRVRPGSLRRRLEDADSVCVEDVVDGSGELGVAIADQEPELLGAVGEVY